MTYFDERLKELHRQKAQKQRLENMLAELKQQENDVAKKAAELEKIKRKEQLDVEQLEGKTIKALFFTLAGTKEEKLSVERQEAYVAAMKHDAAKRDLEGIQLDIVRCQEELASLTDSEAEYKELLEQKKNAIQLEGKQDANEMMLIEKDLAACERETMELEEALDVGYKAFDLVEHIVEELEEAHKLAELDTFIDSMLIDMQKQSHIHSAQDYIRDLRNELRCFKTELADVQIQGDIQIEMDDFSQFADWFFDNVFTDWDIKTKIEKAQKQAEDTRTQLTKVIHLLKDMRDANMKKRFELQETLESLIVGE